MSRWSDICEFRYRIADECMRYNTLGPPPSPADWAKTTTLGNRLGWFWSYACFLIPMWAIRRWRPKISPR